MTTHIRETIIDTAENLIDALTYKARVIPTFRAKRTNFTADQLPAISIYQGDDEPRTIENIQTDRTLSILLEVVTYDEDNFETAINEIAYLITVALNADIKWGNSSIIDTNEIRTSRPEFDANGEVKTATAIMQWDVDYRTSTTDPSGA